MLPWPWRAKLSRKPFNVHDPQQLRGKDVALKTGRMDRLDYFSAFSAPGYLSYQSNAAWEGH